MSKIKEGQKINMLTVVEKTNERKRGYIVWKCICECGNETKIISSNLQSGYTKSCGCLVSKNSSEANTKHGKTHSTEYNTWNGMKGRCLNKNNKDFKNYGGRGIKICDSWLNSFENFYKDMGSKPSKLHSIDRIDNNGNYEPSNCRWATLSQQNISKRRKLGYSGHKLIRKMEFGYIVKIIREKNTRTSLTISLDDAIVLRDKWLKEYDDNPEQWICNTKNRNFKRKLENGG